MAAKKRYVEKRTRIEVVIAYLVVGALCGAMFYYIYQLRNSIFSQYNEIDTQDDLINYTSQFTQAVHEAQGLATQFSLSEKSIYIKQYNEKKNTIQLYADSIKQTTTDTAIINSINEIQNLVVRKGQISYILSRQFYYYDPWSEIYKALENYPGNKVDESNIPNPAINDLLTRSDSTKKSHYPDSIITDIRVLTDKAKTEYRKNINSYQNKINELVESDNALSQKISNILIKLNKEIIASTANGIKESENKIERNIYISTVIAGAVFVMIIIFIILIINDVNKGLRARKAAEDAQKKTEEIMESRHKLLLSVSHDIKTPLTSILGNLDLIDESNENSNKIEAMKQSANHILNLLNNLLDFSRLEQGQLTLNNNNFKIATLCDETATMFQPLADQKSLKFNYTNCIPKDTTITADDLKIKQILNNIISNAIKYTIIGHVDFIARLDNDKLVFNINDSGVGIPKDRIDDIFKPFVRIESYNTFAEGSGYGMSVAKGLCELMDGNITVDSEENNGSRFEITIPVSTTPDNDCNTTPTDSGKTSNILIIDDDNTLLTMMENMIAKLGGKSTVCSSVAMLAEAFKHIDDFDYILTDREMGALTGNEILEKVKQRNPNKPVVLMTARIEYDTKKALDEGFDGLILKPFSISQLANTLHLTLNNIDNEKGSKFSDDFANLYDVMGNDDEAVRLILTTFAQTICDDMLSFNEAIEKNDFEKAKKLCHKVMPILKSLEQDQTLDYLSKMNRLNNTTKNENDYPEWKEDTLLFMQQIDELLDMLSNKYGID